MRISWPAQLLVGQCIRALEMPTLNIPKYNLENNSLLRLKKILTYVKLPVSPTPQMRTILCKFLSNFFSLPSWFCSVFVSQRLQLFFALSSSLTLLLFSDSLFFINEINYTDTCDTLLFQPTYQDLEQNNLSQCLFSMVSLVLYL